MNTFRKAAFTAALGAAAITGGALGASFVGTANAQTDSSSSSAATTTDPAATAPADHQAHDPSKGGHMANGITETLLTGDDATKATAAAQAAVPDGTIDRVENDAEGDAFEAHMTKADGSHVTVKMAADFSVTNIETGR